jgi:hypothetical protein
MKRSIIIALFLISVLPNKVFPLDTSSVKFMPLSVGNIWVYDYSNQGMFQYSTVTRVTADTIANSKRYYKLTGVIFNGWYRCDTVTGNLMQLGNNGCHYDTQESLVDSLAMQFGFYCGNVGRQDSNRVVLGVNVPTYHRQTGSGHSFFYVKYAKYIGPYQSTSFLFNVPIHSYTLRGARINGVLFGDTSGITGIPTVNSDIPVKYSLSQNYPNPFNPQTKIKFDVPQTSFTKLIIYDLLGREVTTLVSEELKAGTYQAEWDALSFSSGVYFYKIISGDYVETKKMVLLK